MYIKRDLVLKVMSNYHAAQIVNEKTIRRKSGLGPLTSTEEIPILEYLKIFEFDTEMMNGVLYCREVKLRFEHQFNEIISEIKEVVDDDFLRKLDAMSFERLAKQLYRTFDTATHLLLRELFPRLPILIVPGRRQIAPAPLYVLLTPSRSNDLDFAFITRLSRTGVYGARVIMLSMDIVNAKLLYALTKTNKLKAIFSYYLNGESYNDWHWIINNLYHADIREEVIDAFKRVNLNIGGDISGTGGMDERIFQCISDELALAK